MPKEIKPTSLHSSATIIFNTNRLLLIIGILLVLCNFLLAIKVLIKEQPAPIVINSVLYDDISKNKTTIIEEGKSHRITATDIQVFIENIVEHLDLKSEYSQIKNLNFLLNVSENKFHNQLLKKQSQLRKTNIKEILNEFISAKLIEKPDVTSHLFFKVNFNQTIYFKNGTSRKTNKETMFVLKKVNRLDYLLSKDNKNIGGKYYGLVLTEVGVNINDI